MCCFILKSSSLELNFVIFSYLDNFRVDFDKDCEDPEYKPLQGPPKDQDDEVRNFHLSLAFLYYLTVFSNSLNHEVY